MQHTSCTEDRIQHALNMCLEGLSPRPASATSWNGKPSSASLRHRDAFRADLWQQQLFLGMKKAVAFSELTPPGAAPEARSAEPKAPVNTQLRHAGKGLLSSGYRSGGWRKCVNRERAGCGGSVV